MGSGEDTADQRRSAKMLSACVVAHVAFLLGYTCHSGFGPAASSQVEEIWGVGLL